MRRCCAQVIHQLWSVTPSQNHLYCWEWPWTPWPSWVLGCQRWFTLPTLPVLGIEPRDSCLLFKHSAYCATPLSQEFKSLTLNRFRNILNHLYGRSLRVAAITYIACNHNTWPISVRRMNTQVHFVVVVITWKWLLWKSWGHDISFQSVLTASHRGVP